MLLIYPLNLTLLLLCRLNSMTPGFLMVISFVSSLQWFFACLGVIALCQHISRWHSAQREAWRAFNQPSKFEGNCQLSAWKLCISKSSNFFFPVLFLICCGDKKTTRYFIQLIAHQRIGEEVRVTYQRIWFQKACLVQVKTHWYSWALFYF